MRISDTVILDELLEKCLINMASANNNIINRAELGLDAWTVEHIASQLEVWETVKEYIEDARK